MSAKDDEGTGAEHGAAQARELWSRKAEEWDRWIGPEGDLNRRLNSNRVLWQLVGDVAGRDVLDAGCGNGYLALQMAQRGARVVGVDWSEAMVAQARARVAGTGVEVRRDDCRHLQSVPDASMDLLVSSYVLMDTPDLDAAVAAFWRVLRPGGRAAIILLHPCFSVPEGPTRAADGSMTFRWSRSYFDEFSFEDSWGPFQSPFIGYHRPLSRYWACFRARGFAVLALEEPVAQEGSGTPEQVQQARMWPSSIAFLLERPRA